MSIRTKFEFRLHNSKMLLVLIPIFYNAKEPDSSLPRLLVDMLFLLLSKRNCRLNSTKTEIYFLFKFNNGLRAGPQSKSLLIRLNSVFNAVPHALNRSVNRSCAA